LFSKILTTLKGELTMDRNLKERTKQFALRIIKLYLALPNRGLTQVLGTQILKSGTSVGAHYREAQRAKSNADFISKIEGALQELDETIYWLELLADSHVIAAKRLEALSSEANELVSILVTIAKRVKSRPKLRKGKTGRVVA
jgi:four helix bundle protein